MPISVIGAGFGRTGTTSLKVALEQLGFGPCHHMTDLIFNPAQIPLWDRVIDDPNVDWDEVLAGYRSAIDWPSSVWYAALAARYPQAKVILTVRDPQRWYDSLQNTIFAPPSLEKVQTWPNRRVVMEGVMPLFGGPERIRDRDHMIRVFNEWNEQVKRTVPSARLLVYDVAEGWAPLCRFLGVPAPDAPFPHTNTTQEFRRGGVVPELVVEGGGPGR